MKHLLIGLLGLALCGSLHAQQQPTTGPAGEPPARGPRGQGPLGRGRGPVLTPVQREATLQWASENMPDLVRYVHEYGRGRGGGQIVALIRARMLAMEQAPPDTPVRDRLRRNITTDNQIGQYLVEMQTATPEQRAELQMKIENAMRENVTGFMEERQERIDRLKARLEMEQRALDRERANLDQIVTRRLMPFQPALSRPGSAGTPAESSLGAPALPAGE